MNKLIAAVGVAVLASGCVSRIQSHGDDNIAPSTSASATVPVVGAR